MNFTFFNPLSYFIVIKTVDIPPQSKGEETSFLIKCNGSCQGIDIKVKAIQYDYDYELFALVDDKPIIDEDDATCAECDNFCSSRTDYSYGSEKTCENLSTSRDSFFVTVYARSSHQELIIQFAGGNILNITEIGKNFGCDI